MLELSKTSKMPGKMLITPFSRTLITPLGDRMCINTSDSHIPSLMEMLSSVFLPSLIEEKLAPSISSFPKKSLTGMKATENYPPSILSPLLMPMTNSVTILKVLTDSSKNNARLEALMSNMEKN